MNRNHIFGTLVLVVSLGGASFCGYLLYQDIYVSKSKHNGVEIAGIVFEKQQNIKRKSGDSMLWEIIGSSDKLYWNDSIQSGARSEATISMKDGNQIKLGESSLVVLERDNDKLSLKLKSGQLVVDSSKSDKPTQQIKVNGMTLAKAPMGTMALNVDEKKGQLTAVMTQSDGTAKQITVDKAGKMEEKEIPAALLKPAPLAKAFSDSPTSQVSFSWAAKEKSKKVFELSRDKDFKQIFIKKELEENSYQAELDPGFYYWRVKVPAKSEELASETRSFNIVYTAFAEPLVPVANSKITYRRDIPTIEFSWKGNSACNKYVVEVSATEDFKTTLIKDETPNLYWRSSRLTDGKLFWRVNALYGDITKVGSSRSFEIEKLKEVKPPELVLPEANFTLTYETFAKFNGIAFKWKTEANETYKFIFSQKDNLKNPILEFETTQTEALVATKPNEGNYYWSVGHKNLDGEWEYQEPRKLIVGPMVPPPTAPLAIGPQEKSTLDLMDNTLVKWQWKEVAGAKEYKFKLFKVDQKKNELILEDVLKKNEKEKNDLPDGNYKWVLSTVDSYGRESQPAEHQFTVSHGTELEAPDFEMTEVQ